MTEAELATAAAKQKFEILDLKELVALAIEEALRRTGGNIMKTCRILNIGKATLYRRLQEPRFQRVLQAARAPSQ